MVYTGNITMRAPISAQATHYKLRQLAVIVGISACILYLCYGRFIHLYVSSSITHTCFTVLELICVAIVLLSEKISGEMPRSITLLFSLYFALIICNGLLFEHIECMIRGYQTYLLYALYFPMCILLCKRVNLQALLKLFLLLNLPNLLSVIAEWFFNFTIYNDLDSLQDTSAAVAGMGYARLGGLLGNCFILAIVLCICILICVHLFKRERRFVYLAYAMLCIPGIYATGSRGPFVALVISLLIMLALSETFNFRIIDIRPVLLVLIVLLVVGVFAFSLSANNVELSNAISRVQSIFDWSSDLSNQQRFKRWMEMLGLYSERPIFGFGIGTTGQYAEYSLGNPESGVIKRLVETGIVGTLSYLGILLAIFAYCARRLKGANKGDMELYALFTGIFTMVFIEDMVVQIFQNQLPSFLLWFGLAGMLVIALKQTHKVGDVASTSSGPFRAQGGNGDR